MHVSATEWLAESLSDLGYDALPLPVVERARECVLDSIGCMLAGSRIAEIRTPVDLVLHLAQSTGAAVPGLSGRYPAPFAAYAAAQFANGIDADDTVLGVGHPGAAVIGAALALAQTERSSSDDLFLAVATGYEVAIRIGRSITPSPARAEQVRGHSWAVFGAAAAAAKLLRLDTARIATALGLAAQHALVPFVGKWYERPITGLKNNYGWAAAGGVLAALYAAHGVPGTPRVLDGDSGFWAMAGSDRWRPELVIDRAETSFAILDVEFKPYACCRYLHTVLDALDSIRAQFGDAIHPDSIRTITVRSGRMIERFADYEPRSILDAQFSLPYVVSLHVSGCSLLNSSFVPGRFDHLMRRVQIEVDPEMDRHATLRHLPARVEVGLKTGTRLVAESATPPGGPDRPLDAAFLRAKFLALAVPVVGEQRAQHLVSVLQDPTRSVTADELSQLFRVGDEGAS